MHVSSVPYGYRLRELVKIGIVSLCKHSSCLLRSGVPNLLFKWATFTQRNIFWGLNQQFKLIRCTASHVVFYGIHDNITNIMHMHTHQFQTLSLKPVGRLMVCLYVIQKIVGPGVCREISSAREKNELHAARKFFCYGVGQKSSGVECSGVEIPCSRVEIGG